jgi:ubiquitin carboxyl-terminal hydrolase 25/28
MKKTAQTRAPLSDIERPESDTLYVVASYCMQCKHHFDIIVDFTERGKGQRPCRLSDTDNPMHHLRRVKSWSSHEHSDSPVDKYNPLLEHHRWACSGRYCPVTVDIKISSPRLPLSLVPTITNASKLEARGKRVIEEEPERYVGLEPLSPIQVFSNIRAYLSDAKSARGPNDLKKIARRNKKYFLAFADECDDLFTYLDFTAIEEEDDTVSISSWNPWFWQRTKLICLKERDEPFLAVTCYNGL